ncbi:peptide-methionine (S)-S-oxide reductase MsrA [Caldimonas tepidiphila]|uniref:peptide-methionine (S)-S-oxide reductase MsrA n=1 Tax=Caldimonas tepidiphila TaxID=2315841 RepID=UPI000E5AF733|nr:peptide-methionine (S)-S-oxide reductase MsrA [Caldimonas tepidiphila]
MSRLRRCCLVATVLLSGGTLASAQTPAKAATPSAAAGTRVATAMFSGGSFWALEAAFDRVAGVLSTTPGYTGGPQSAPTYEQVFSGRTDHVEAVEVRYDPAKVRYEQLLAYYWRRIDPTSRERQFCDEGPAFRPMIFAHDEAQLEAALASKSALQRRNPFGKPIVVRIQKAARFHPAEDYHQDFYRRNPVEYRQYSDSCGRAQQLRRLWGRAEGL